MPTAHNRIKNIIYVWYNPVRDICYLCYRDKILKRIPNKFKVFSVR